MTSLAKQDWLERAARQPVAFAQVREDPSIDLALLERLGERLRVVMVASGGCNAASLVGSGRMANLHLVDLNRSQVALTRLKLALLRGAGPESRMELLGHSPGPAGQRREEGLAWLRRLELPDDVLGDVGTWSRLGIDHCGRYEMLFARLSARVRLQGDLPSAFQEVMSQEHLETLFGSAATSNRVTDFWRHFLHQTEAELLCDPERRGPFLSQMLDGRFRGRPHHWLNLDPPLEWPEIRFEVAPISEALSRLESASCDYLHLSNTLDWVTEQEAQATLAQATRVLRPGGLVAVRQLNSTIPVRGIGSGLEWDAALSQRLLEADRSFFYRNLHVGKRPWS